MSRIYTTPIISAVALWSLIILISCHPKTTPVATKPVNGNRYLIPETGVSIVATTQPELSTEQFTANGKDLTVRNYNCILPSTDSAFYMRHTGVYPRLRGVDSVYALNIGLQRYDKLFEQAGCRMLKKEAFRFKGRSAWRIKGKFEGEQLKQYKGHFVYLMLVAHESLLLEFAVFDKRDITNNWWQNEFFDQITFNESMPSRLSGLVNNTDACPVSFPCYFRENGIAVQFPGAPVILPVYDKVAHYQVQRYHLAAVNDSPTLFYGLEIYTNDEQYIVESNEAPVISSSVWWNRLLGVTIREDQIISRKSIKFKDKNAVETITRLEIPKDGKTESVTMRSLTFIRRGKIINVFVFTRPDAVQNSDANCFFDAIYWE